MVHAVKIDGAAGGTTNWSAGNIPLVSGDNIITVTAKDAAGIFFSKNANTTGIKYVAANITDGYTVELAIPRANLGITAPAANMTIGIDVQQNDDDNGGDRDGILNWNNPIDANFQSTVGFGHLVLSATTVGQDTAPAAPTGLKVME
ncbi:MAG: hypothetical protein IT291_10825 [Deltaproteobacteria bacterium]|nr:hypothetical protein [Deltaproteobacteria bacterium]